jgi:hypothetical protein
MLGLCVIVPLLFVFGLVRFFRQHHDSGVGLPRHATRNGGGRGQSDAGTGGRRQLRDSAACPRFCSAMRGGGRGAWGEHTRRRAEFHFWLTRDFPLSPFLHCSFLFFCFRFWRTSVCPRASTTSHKEIGSTRRCTPLNAWLGLQAPLRLHAVQPSFLQSHRISFLCICLAHTALVTHPATELALQPASPFCIS